MVSTPQSPQAPFAGGTQVIGLAVHVTHLGVVGIANNSKFGCQHDLVAPTANCFSNQLFIGERPAYVGRVQQSNAQLKRSLDGGNRLTVIAWSVNSDMPMQLRPMAETLRPLRPNWRVFMADPPCKVNEKWKILDSQHCSGSPMRFRVRASGGMAHPDRCGGSTDDSPTTNWLAASARTTGRNPHR